jgi:hypothetical protein
MSVLINASTSTGLVQSADTSGEIELQSNGTTALKVNTNEGIQILNCLGVGNATPSTSGAGITFPASQSASTDANTLDDYEEGTWTPVINGTTMSAGSGWYTKIGRQVFCGFNNLQGVAAVGDNVATNVSGMPFAITSYTQGGAISMNFNDESDSYKGRVLVARTTNTQIEFCNRSAVATTTSDPFNMVASYQVL